MAERIMITGNALDTFRIYFNDGKELSLIARNYAHAHWTASELLPEAEVVRVEKLGMWEDNDDAG